jgi:hypothetical protein
MDPRNRVILPLRFPEQNESRRSTDVSGLLLHLLLFDTVIVPSIRLLDVAEAAKALGISQMIELIDTGVLKTRAEVDQIRSFNEQGDVVQMARLFAPDPDKTLTGYMDSLDGLARTAGRGRACSRIARRSTWPKSRRSRSSSRNQLAHRQVPEQSHSDHQPNHLLGRQTTTPYSGGPSRGQRLLDPVGVETSDEFWQQLTAWRRQDTVGHARHDRILILGVASGYPSCRLPEFRILVEGIALTDRHCR